MDELEAVTRITKLPTTVDTPPADPPLTICLATPEYPIPGLGTPSGVGSAVHALAHGLVKAGHYVSVVTFSRERPGSWLDDGVQVHALRPGQFHWYVHKLPGVGQRLSLPFRELENSLAMWLCVRALHQHTPFDVIEATETEALLLSRLYALPLVIRLHGEEHTFLRHTPGARLPLAHRLSRTVQRIALKHATGLISPSQIHAEEIACEIGCPVAEIAVVPNTLSRVWQTWRVEQANTVREPLILFIGRMERLKGILDALTSFAQIARIVPDLRLVIIGAHHQTVPEETIADLIKRLQLTERVVLLGRRPQVELATWYARAQVFLMPSYYETFGMVALEAMTFGLPVVGYRAGALPEIVERGNAGILVAPGDMNGLAEAVLALLQDGARWSAMSQAARSRAAFYQQDQNVALTLAAYHSARIHRHQR